MPDAKNEITVYQPNEVYIISGNRFIVKTLDLNQEFPKIARQLDDIAAEAFPCLPQNHRMRDTFASCKSPNT